MVKLTSSLQRLEKIKALVAGDLMLDTYTIGKAKRISPEAPVAVVQVQKEERRPGGAGNVMLNLLSLGSDVIALGRIGGDTAGSSLLKAIQDEGVDARGIVVQEGYPTPVKNRIIAENQQIVRVDNERIEPLPEHLEQTIIEQIPLLLQNVKIVAISDYGKGTLTPKLLKALIAQARLMHIPIIADPKGMDFTRYAGSTVIKPNLSEAYAAARLSHDAPLEQVAERVLESSQAEALMVTRSEAGISIFHRLGGRYDFPVRVKEVKDVTGAGDTVLATLACAMANGLTLEEAAQLSNIAAGIAIERFGCARVTLSDLARRLLEDKTANKVFDDDHLFALNKALDGHYSILLGIDSTHPPSASLFQTIQRFAGRESGYLIVYIFQQAFSEDLANILVSFREVDFVIRQTHPNPHLSTCLRPNEIYLFKDGNLLPISSVEALAGGKKAV